MAQPQVKPVYKDVKAPSPAPILDKLKAWVSPASVAGKSRDYKKKQDDALAAAGI